MPDHRNAKIDYIEIPTRDICASKAFFSALFGWEFEDFGPDYTCFHDGRLAGGFFVTEVAAQVATGSVLVVFFSDRLEESREQVKHLGGNISRDIFSFPGGRRFHFITPSGNEFAIWSDTLAPSPT